MIDLLIVKLADDLVANMTRPPGGGFVVTTLNGWSYHYSKAPISSKMFVDEEGESILALRFPAGTREVEFDAEGERDQGAIFVTEGEASFLYDSVWVSSC
jgi:hypothetical protein